MTIEITYVENKIPPKGFHLYSNIVDCNGVTIYKYRKIITSVEESIIYSELISKGLLKNWTIIPDIVDDNIITESK